MVRLKALLSGLPVKEPAATSVTPSTLLRFRLASLGVRSGLLRGAVYHDDFETPGISPRSASPRKHKRQMPNFRRYARGRPHSLQRLCLRVENLGFLFALAILDVLAIVSFIEP